MKRGKVRCVCDATHGRHPVRFGCHSGHYYYYYYLDNASASLSRPYSPQQQASCALDEGVEVSEPFNIERGVLQGDIFSPVCFIAGLDRIFRLYDHMEPSMTVGTGAHTVRMAKFEYA